MSDLSLAPSRSDRPVLADLVVGLRDRTLVLVLAGTLLTALASQIRIPLGFTPVPINLGTFAVALVGGVLGARRGVMSIALYLALGLVGLPFFQGWNGGWSYATGATAGYLVGYLVMAVVVGAAAERGRDRRPLPFLAAIVLANAAVSGRVVGVDPDVAVGEVAAPHRGRRVAGAERDTRCAPRRRACSRTAARLGVVEPRRVHLGVAEPDHHPSWSMSVSSLHLPIAIATRPQFGSAPCTAVFTSGEFTIALATALGLRRGRGPVDRHLDERLGALAVACDLLGERHATSWSASSNSVGVDRAGGAAREHDRGVARRRVGVDAHAVERAVDHRTEHLSRASPSTSASVSTRRSAWPCRARSSRHPWRPRRPRRVLADDAAVGDLRDRVGGHDPRRPRRRRTSPSGVDGIAATPARIRSIG
jgi:biotin transport system substrate-specific component